MATWDQFARALLGALGAPTTADNEAALLTWFNAEQPPNSPNGAFNPLNVQNDDFAGLGYTKTRSGQWNFPSFQVGVAAVARELNTGLYAPIKSALLRGTDPGGVLAAVQSSPWAAGHYGGRLVGEYNPGNLARLGTGVIGGGGASGSLPSVTGVPSPFAASSGPGGVAIQPANAVTDALGSIWGLLPNPFAAVGSAIGKDVARIVLTGTFVAGGVAVIALGLYRAVAPSVRETTSQAAPLVGAAGGRAAAGGASASVPAEAAVAAL